MRLASVAVAAPLLTLAFRALVAVSGDRVVSNYDIAAFLFSPAGAVLAVGGAAAGAALLLVELAGFTYLADCQLAGRQPPLAETLGFLARRFRAILALGARLVVRLTLITLPFAAAAGLAAHAWLGEHDINYYLAERPPEWLRTLRVAAVLGAACGVAILWQLLRWFLALPALVARPACTAAQALAESSERTRGRLGGLVKPLLGWWLLAALAASALFLIGRALSAAAFDWARMDLARVMAVVATCLAVTIVVEFLVTGLALAGQQFIAVRAWRQGRDSPAAPAAGAPAADAAPGVGRLAARTVAAVLALAAVAALGSWLALSRMDLRPQVEVTAHRGASVAAPENTMAAFRAAIAAGTDWIELDVQRTQDGRIAVLHDADFMRVAGDARRVGEVAAADLAGIDIGRRYGGAFAGERPPLLEEVIALVRGRARLNVELKYNAPDPALAPAVVALLRRENFLADAVLTSLDYAALRQVEAIEPAAVTGHIVTAAIGDVLRTEADFLSLNAAQATVPLVRRAHRAGKAVHVWTVNTRDAMIELAARGVDNIITDDPALFARVRREVGALEPQELLGLRLRALAGRPSPELADPEEVAPL